MVGSLGGGGGEEEEGRQLRNAEEEGGQLRNAEEEEEEEGRQLRQGDWRFGPTPSQLHFLRRTPSRAVMVGSLGTQKEKKVGSLGT